MDPLILMIEPELDERAATSTMARAQRVYEEGARDISRVMRDQMNQGTTAAAQGFGELETKARKAYLSMQDASEKVAAAERKHQQAVANGAANAESLGRRVERLRLAEIEAIERATAAYNEYGQAAQQAGQQATGGLRGAVAGIRTAGGEAASGFMEGFAGSAALMRLGSAAGPIGLAIASAAALGVAGGKVLVDNILAGMEQLRMRDLFQARLGVDTPTMEKVGNAAGTAFANGYGESVEENLKTISAGISAGLIGPRSSDADLAKFTERMDTTSKITGQDPGEIASKSRNIIRAGLANNYTEVLDLLNSEGGKQLDISGDLLDTTEEYATAWHGVGLSAADAFGLMKQMSDAGIRNTDVAADSLKELSINVADNSKTTRAAFVALGFDADDMNRRFAEGGATAREAFGAVLTAMQDMKDPQDKTNIGLALFKTKWEDAKTAIEAASLKTAATDMGKVAGATDDATKQINTHADAWGNLGSKISEMWDKTERKLADSWLGKFVGKTLPDGVSQFLDWSSRNLDPKPAQPAQPKVFGPPMPSNSSRFALPPGATPSLAPNDLGGLLGDTPPPPTTADFRGWYGPGVRPPDAPPLTHGAQGHYSPEDAAGSKSLPPAPVLPLQYTNTAGLPSGIANAQQSLDEKVHDVAEKEARLNQLKQTNVATADDIQKAENDLTKANQDRLKAEQSLTDARINAMKQANKQFGKMASDLDELGASLDKDFGISKGLGGIVENLVKAVGNALAAPFLQALGFVAKANPNEGSGIVGMIAANGMFGPQYTPGAIAAAGQTGSMVPGGAYMPGAAGGAPSEAQVKAIAASFGLQVTSEDRPGDTGYHGKGMALDVSNGQGNTPQMRAFADYMSQNFGPYLKELIYSDGSFRGQIGDGQNVAGTGYYSSGTLSDHQNHVHVAAQWGEAAAPIASASNALQGFTSAVTGATGALGGQVAGDKGSIAKAIFSSVLGAGYSPATAMTAVQAGLLESGLNTSAQNQGHNSLFQTSADKGVASDPASQINWLLGEMGRQGGPAVANADPLNFFADRIERGGYPGSNYNQFLPQAQELVGAGGTLPPTPGGGPMYPGIGPSQALPGMSPLGQVTPGMGGGTAYPTQGGNSGNILGGMAMDGIMAATSGLDMLAPGTSAAAKIGIQVANRSIGYAAQNAGIAANAIGEFFSVGDNPKGSIGAGWFGKLAGGIAGAAPALPNLAGGKKPPGPMDQAQGGQQQGGNTYGDTNITVQSREGASGQEHGEQIAAERGRMFAPAGRQ